MKFTPRHILLVCLGLASTSGAPREARAAPYDEAILGDISGDPQAPMPWTLDLGANPLTGTAGGNFFEGESEFDLVAFTVPAGRQLDSVTISQYQNVDEFAMSFLGLQAGSPWLDNLGWDIQGFYLLGWMHLTTGLEGVNALEEMKSHSDSPDFHIPMPSGVYTLLIEDVDNVMSYSLIFNVSAVPEPGGGVLAAAGAAAIARRRGRRQ